MHERARVRDHLLKLGEKASEAVGQKMSLGLSHEEALEIEQPVRAE